MDEIIEFISNQNQWMTAVFAVYTLFIFVFAIIYHEVYLKYPGSFSFNEKVRDTQKLIFANDAEGTLEKLRYEVMLLKELLQHITGHDYSSKEEGRFEFKLPSGHTVYTQKGVRMGRRRSYTVLTLSILNDQRLKKYVHTWTLYRKEMMPQKFSELKGPLEDSARYLEDKAKELERRLNTVETEAPEIWSIFDFLYFSVITQTTVGYGDILPNSTTVRKLVMSQVIIGYIMLVIIINLSVST